MQQEMLRRKADDCSGSLEQMGVGCESGGASNSGPSGGGAEAGARRALDQLRQLKMTCRRAVDEHNVADAASRAEQFARLRRSRGLQQQDASRQVDSFGSRGWQAGKSTARAGPALA